MQDSSERMLEGVRVIDTSEWGFVPASTAILADWGADVIKIEHPGRGDSMRSLIASDGVEKRAFNQHFEQFNRGKRSLGLDLAAPGGRDVLLELVRDADVFVTSFLEPARVRLGITYEELSEVNPRLVYAKGHGQGQRGDGAGKPGYDGISFWARGGSGHLVSPADGPILPMPAGAYGDVQAGTSLAGGIAAALFRRSVTGKGGVVDVSLFGVSCWVLGHEIIFSHYLNQDTKPLRPSGVSANPIQGQFRTGDGRWVHLSLHQSDRYWETLCTALGLEDLYADETLRSFHGRASQRVRVHDEVASAIGGMTLCRLLDALGATDIPHAPFQTPLEVASDPQTQANGYLIDLWNDGSRRAVTSSPVQYNDAFIQPKAPAPEIGQHTEEILLERGYSWDRISELKEARAIS